MRSILSDYVRLKSDPPRQREVIELLFIFSLASPSLPPPSYLPRPRRNVLIRGLRLRHARIDTLSVNAAAIDTGKDPCGTKQREHDKKRPVGDVGPPGSEAIVLQELRFRRNAERGEVIGVMNRNAARHFMAFNNAFPSGGVTAPNYFANGGIVSREMAQQQINMDELAAKIAQANASLPPPVVAVQDIVTEGNSYVRVRDGANF